MVTMGYYYQQGSHRTDSEKTKSANVKQTSVFTDADQAYISAYAKKAVMNYRALREGSTAQRVVLPSGVIVNLVVIKTKTGWCPIRHQNLYSISTAINGVWRERKEDR